MGGYALARSAHVISALDVIAAFDGPPVITSCATVHGDCEMASHCKVKG
jgi:DNA-binding IscR family transcriptional regulator